MTGDAYRPELAGAEAPEPPSRLGPTGGISIARDARGRFAKLVCVNAHDCCHLIYPPCPYCEIKQ